MGYRGSVDDSGEFGEYDRLVLDIEQVFLENEPPALPDSDS